MDNCKQNEIDFLPYINRRQDLLENYEVPLQSEMASQLGEPLANVVNSTMTDVGKILMGTYDKLQGPPRDLWISPSDHLIGKVRLTFPYSDKLLKALTHQTIIELGMETEEKIKNEMEATIEKVKAETSNFEKFKSCKLIKHAVKKEREEQEYIRKTFKEELIKKYERKLEKIKKCYEESIALRVKYVIKKCDIETQKFIQEDRRMVEEFVRSELTKCYEKKVDKMKNDFQNGIIHAIEHQKAMDYDKLKEMHHEYKLELKTDRNHLKCEHIVDLMHLLSAEKAKFNQKLHKTKSTSDEEIKELHCLLNKLLNYSPEIKECPNIKIWHDKCQQILQNYEELVDKTVSDISGQGAYLTKIHKMLEIQMAETYHPSNNYKCYQETKRPTGINIPIEKVQEILNKTYEDKVISKGNYKTNKINKPKLKSNKDKKEPFKIYFDHIKKESTPESSDSLASIEFDGKKYISLNKFLEKAVKIPSDPDIKISQIETESDSESSILTDDSLFIIDNINDVEAKRVDVEIFTKKIKSKIRTDVISAAIVKEITNSNIDIVEDLVKIIDNIINNHIQEMINVKQVKSLVDTDSTLLKNKRKSKLLAVTDSLEIYKEKLAEIVQEVVQPLEQDLILETVDSIDLIRPKSQKELDVNLTKRTTDETNYINKMTMDQYMKSFEKVPPYLFTNLTPEIGTCFKDEFFKTTSDREICKILQKFKDRQSVVKSVTSIVSGDTPKVQLEVISKENRKASILKTHNSYENRDLTFKKSKTERSEFMNNQIRLRSLVDVLEDDAEIANLLRRY